MRGKWRQVVVPLPNSAHGAVSGKFSVHTDSTLRVSADHKRKLEGDRRGNWLSTR
jgi:hypothetical protein